MGRRGPEVRVLAYWFCGETREVGSSKVALPGVDTVAHRRLQWIRKLGGFRRKVAETPHPRAATKGGVATV